MRAIGYTCLNTVSQQPKNLTLEDQEKTIQQYADNRGWSLVGIYQEVTESTNTMSQPKLEQIILDSGQDTFDILVIARLDRLTRNIRQLNTLINRMCLQNGKHLNSIEEGFDTRNECGQLGLRLIDIITKWDTKRISDRTREIIAKKRAKGERVGHAPFGYTYKDKRLVIVPAELDTVRVIREQREKGLSYHKIARYLNERKIVSKRGGIWYAETVKTVFQNSLIAHDYLSPLIPGALQSVGI
jgi:DNA invertase Pin-like site-specific DNA recombinase